jgi:hypothetical protein
MYPIFFIIRYLDSGYSAGSTVWFWKYRVAEYILTFRSKRSIEQVKSLTLH